MGKVYLGVIADDFTGASDVASFFANQDIKTIMFNGIPKKEYHVDSDCVLIIALKTRTESTELAVKESKEALAWLSNMGANQLYIKYCSTFDSTSEGNIGPILDMALEEYNEKYTIVAPALPINGRIVKNGELLVNGVKLNKTHMRNHPLTPMKESSIKRLLQPQTKYNIININYNDLMMRRDVIKSKVEFMKENNEHFYIIPDYINEEHSKKIIENFGDNYILSGGSGIITELAKKFRNEDNIESIKLNSQAKGKAIILVGSCSEMTLKQVRYYKENTENETVKIEPLRLINNTNSLDEIFDKIKNNKNDSILIYSSDTPTNIEKNKKKSTEDIAMLIEQAFSEIAEKALEYGYGRLIVAGGETSGAVIKKLKFNSYKIGKSIAPGVPVMTPFENDNIRVILKSGNFGLEDFFIKSIDETRLENGRY